MVFSLKSQALCLACLANIWFLDFLMKCLQIYQIENQSLDTHLGNTMAFWLINNTNPKRGNPLLSESQRDSILHPKVAKSVPDWPSELP